MGCTIRARYVVGAVKCPTNAETVLTWLVLQLAQITLVAVST